MNEVKLSRRKLFKASALAGGGFLLQMALPISVLAAEKDTLVRSKALNVYVQIDADGQITIYSAHPEMGQGIMTSLPMIVAEETGQSLRITSGPAINHAGDLAAVLSSLVPGEILFIDEIHRMARPAEEMLYLAMEDFRIDIMVGKGAGATTLPLDLAPFTLVGATTRSGLLPGPLRDRFGFTAHLEFYSESELTEVVDRSSAVLGLKWPREALGEIASRSRGTPRIANRLLRRVRDYVLVHDSAPDVASVKAALTLYDVDDLDSTVWIAWSSRR